MSIGLDDAPKGAWCDILRLGEGTYLARVVGTWSGMPRNVFGIFDT